MQETVGAEEHEANKSARTPPPLPPPPLPIFYAGRAHSVAFFSPLTSPQLRKCATKLCSHGDLRGCFLRMHSIPANGPMIGCRLRGSEIPVRETRSGLSSTFPLLNLVSQGDRQSERQFSVAAAEQPCSKGCSVRCGAVRLAHDRRINEHDAPCAASPLQVLAMISTSIQGNTTTLSAEKSNNHNSCVCTSNSFVVHKYHIHSPQGSFLTS